MHDTFDDGREAALPRRDIKGPQTAYVTVPGNRRSASSSQDPPTPVLGSDVFFFSLALRQERLPSLNSETEKAGVQAEIEETGLALVRFD